LIAGFRLSLAILYPLHRTPYALHCVTACHFIEDAITYSHQINAQSEQETIGNVLISNKNDAALSIHCHLSYIQ